jgi:hypothetical protein
MDGVNKDGHPNTTNSTCSICHKKLKAPRRNASRKTNIDGTSEKAKGTETPEPESCDSGDGNRSPEEDQNKTFPWMAISRTNDKTHLQGKR